MGHTGQVYWWRYHHRVLQPETNMVTMKKDNHTSKARSRYQSIPKKRQKRLALFTVLSIRRIHLAERNRANQMPSWPASSHDQPQGQSQQSWESLWWGDLQSLLQHLCQVLAMWALSQAISWAPQSLSRHLQFIMKILSKAWYQCPDSKPKTDSYVQSASLWPSLNNFDLAT